MGGHVVMNEVLIDRKIEYWENQLLDLGKRNKMISYRETKRATLKILEPEFETLFSRLVIGEEELTFQKAIDKDSDIRVYSVLALMDSLSAPVEVRLGDIKTAGTIDEAKKTLKNLRSKSKLALDEQGTNILYMVFGFVEWKEKGSRDDNWIKSPLILVPVSLILESLNAPFTLKKYEDDIVVNPTLAYLFERDYGITLPTFEPEEDSLVDFMNQMEELVDLRGWRIIRETSMGLVSFLKINMYKDLLNDEEEIKQNPIIQAFAGDTTALGTIDINDIDFNHDKEKATELYQVVDADSSQQDAILLSQKGASFVMQGPPGTGKSQTITNIIAQGLADGKKILFVSEKMAALEVVYKRLEEVHLADFCLALHSHKANKKEILEQLGSNLNLKHIKIKDEEVAKLTQLDVLREKLATYVKDIHVLIMPLEMSLYEVYGALAELQEFPDIRVQLENIGNMSKDQVNRICLLVENLDKTRTVLGEKWYKNPWQGLRISRLGTIQKKELQDKLNTIVWLLEKAPEDRIIEDGGILEIATINNVEHYIKAIELAEQCKIVPREWFYKELNTERITVNEMRNMKESLTSLRTQFLDVYEEKYLFIDAEKMFKDLNDYLVRLRILLNSNLSDDDFYENFNAISSDLKEYIFDVKRLKEIFVKLSKEFDVYGKEDTISNLELYLNVCDVLLEKEQVATEIQKVEDGVTNNCETSVFELDYIGMLDRFKSEYTNIFKYFKKEYREDKKSVRLSYKEVKKKLSDDEIIELLQTLKHRGELIDSKNTLLKKVAGLLGKNDFRDLGMSFKKQELSDVRLLINKINEFKEKYPNILQINIADTEEKIVLAQEEMDNLTNLISELKSYLKSDRHYSDMKSDLKGLMQFQVDEQTYNIRINEVKQIIPFGTINKDTNWNLIVQIIDCIKELNILINENGIVDQWLLFITDSENNRSRSQVEDFLREVYKNKHVIEEFTNLFEDATANKLKILASIKRRIEKCLNQFDSMDAWIDYRDCKKACVDNGLADFILQSEDVIYPYHMLDEVFLKAFYYAWIEEKISSIPSVSGFNSRVHTDNVCKFRELDTHQLPVAQMRIREKLINGMPDRTMFNRAGDEMSVLIHELGKKRKIMPIRKLFRSIPNLLLKLKPCLMMSPLSVSYFLEADTYKFDMIIFDEASQIFPQDAIGAIFRGAQVIIAGDSKQLPPTNFFSASTSNDSDYDVDSDDEDEIISDSILEEATNTIPNRSLLWHYRSRNEDLISFSNKEIYGNNLVTFPSSKVNEADSGVEYIYVSNGVYENRCNKEEATRCVSLIENHIKRHPDRSLGIIAFSESQQSTIEDAVQEFRNKHREYDAFFSEEKEEPFFIKNLENVQGDERDTIIFSICYGKNSQGRMYMRFGPLGHQGGERRLNVAITRAKFNVKLVGSILPGDIDLTKTKSDGVKMLRSYIEFASRKSGQINAVQKKNRLYETDVFSEYVAKYLAEYGYKVKRDVGNSDYTVDIAIEHPEVDGCYVAGIECDGDSYQMARTVRDRDHLRVAVMERMGWRMYRVWSTEWVQNEQDAKTKLLNFINEAIKNYASYEVKKEPEKEIDVATEEVKQFSSTSQKMVNKNNPYNLERYREGDWRDVSNFRAYDNESRIADRIHEVVRVEQPIHIELLYKRMASCFGNERVTNPVRYTIDLVMKQKMRREIRIDSSQFVTLSDYKGTMVRRSLPGSPDRNIEYISQEEIQEAIKLVLAGAFGVEVSALILETARIFGFEKTGAKIKQSILKALNSLEEKNIVRISDERVQLLEER